MRGTKPTLVVDNKTPVVSRPAPEWMSEEARAEWERVLPILSGRKIVGEADMGLLENYCVSVGRSRQIERMIQEKGDDVDLRLLRLQDKIIQTCRQLAVEVGLTPSARSRPAFREKEEDRGFDLFSTLDL